MSSDNQGRHLLSAPICRRAALLEVKSDFELTFGTLAVIPVRMGNIVENMLSLSLTKQSIHNYE